MSSNKLSVLNLVAITDYFRKDSSTNYVACVDHPNTSTIKEYEVHISQLLELHPLLPVAIDAVLDHRKKLIAEDPIIRSMLVELNMHVLKNGYTEVNDTTNATPWSFVEIDNMRENVLDRDTLLVSGTAVTVDHVKHGDLNVPVVIDDAWYEITVSKNEMDSRFPGWEERWKLGAEIGVDNLSLMRHVFTVNNVVTPPSLDITFD